MLGQIRGGSPANKIVGQRATSLFVRTSRFREDQQVPHQRGRPPRIRADLAQATPVLQVCEAVLDRGTHCGQCLVGQLLATGEGLVPGGLATGDHCRVGVRAPVVEPDESQVGEGSEAGRAEMCGEFAVAASGDLRGPPGPGRRDPQQSAPVVGERMSVSSRNGCRSAPGTPWIKKRTR
jgi:hypothetical protein